MFSDFKPEIKLFLLVAAVSAVLAVAGILLLQAGLRPSSPTPDQQQTIEQTPPPAPSPQPQTELLDTSDWQTYRNEEFGFEVRYPDYFVQMDQGVYELEVHSSRSDRLRVILHPESIHGFVYRVISDGSIAYAYDDALDSWISINPDVSSDEWAPKRMQAGDLIYYSIQEGGPTVIERAFISHPKEDIVIEVRTSRNESWIDCIELCPEQEPWSDKNTIHQILSTFRFVE